MSEKLEFDFAVKTNQVDKALDSAIKKAGTFEKVAETAMGVFGGGIALKAFEALADGFNMIIAVGKECVEGASENEIAVNNLNSALKRAGNYSKEASASLQEYADSIEDTSTITAEAVLENTALLQSLTRLDEQGLKAGVSAAADFAAVLGIDLESATRLVAKAANGNTEAFSKFGVEIQKGSTNTESFTNTVKALNDQFGGASASKLNTFQGSMTALENSLGKILDPMGNIIVKNPELIGTFNALKSAIVGAGGAAEALSPVLSEKLSNAINDTFTVIKVLADAFDGITRVTKFFTNTILAVADAITLGVVYPIEKAIDAIIYVGKMLPEVGSMFDSLKNPIAGASDELKKLTQTAYGDAVNSLTNDNVFTAISDTVSVVGENAKLNAEKIRQANATIEDSSKSSASAVDDTAEAVLTARTNLANELLALEMQTNNELMRFNEEKNALEIEDAFERNEAKINAMYEQKVREAEVIRDGELLKAAAEADSQTQVLMATKANNAFALAETKARYDKELSLRKSKQDQEKILDKQREFDQRSTLMVISSLASENNKALAGIGKAAALTQIAIDGPVAVSKALAAFPPPFNFAAATAVGAAVAVQAAKVAGIQFNSGGFVDGANGATMGPDTVTAQVRKGEMVLNGDQQKTLFNAINNGGMGFGGEIVVQIDGREIARALKNQLKSGFVL